MTSSAPQTVLSDEALAAGQGLAVLYERYSPRLLPFLARQGVPERDLEDVHHEVWLRVEQWLQERSFEGHFRGWLFQIARNLAVDHSRKKRPCPLPADETVALTLSPAETLLHREQEALLRRCLERLPTIEKDVVRALLSGDDYPAISQRLGVAPQRAHKLFFQAKARLASCMESSGT